MFRCIYLKALYLYLNIKIFLSDNDSVNYDKYNRKSEHEINDFSEEPRKINPKIKLHFDVHRNKCDVPNCALSPNW